MMLAKKAILFLKQEGLKNTIIRTCQKIWELFIRIPAVLKERLKIDFYCNEVQNAVAGREVFFLIPNIDWYIKLYQRPHQMATALSKRDNTCVLFVSDQYRYDNFAGVERISDNLMLISRRIVPKLYESLKNAKSLTVIMSWPKQKKLLDYIPADRLIYEYIDDLSLFYYMTDEMREDHLTLMKQADVTVCTSRDLYEKALPVAKKAMFSPNAGDYAFFHETKSCKPAPELINRIKDYSRVIGYYGCLASWFDYDLIIEAAKRRPDWCFLIVGYCYDGTSERFKKEKQRNVVVFPAQPYRNLPHFLTAFDIAMIPFVINDVTRATSPVKLFEYMSAGKPVLTSKMPECLNYRSVYTYDGIEDFLEKAELLIGLREDADYLSLLEKEAKENTWDARCEQIIAQFAEK